MWTLISWLVVAVFMWWITGRIKSAFDVMGHMLAFSVLITGVLWWLTGADRVLLWYWVSHLVPALVLVLSYWYIEWVLKHDR